MSKPTGKQVGVGGGAIALAAILFMAFEGYVPGTYKDPLGILTACYGHTGPELEAGQRFTKAECDAFLREDLAEANAIVRACIAVPMPVQVEAALTDFAANVGPGGKGVKDGLCWLKSGKQPTIRRRANAGDWRGVCDAFMDWTQPNNPKIHKGIKRRREAERALCLEGV